MLLYSKRSEGNHLTGSTIIFYLLALLTLVSAVLSVTSRQIFRSAIYLLFTLIGIAGLYFWLQYDFIAAVQIVVYVGGITVLIIFSIFLTQQAGELLPQQKTSSKILSALAASGAAALVLLQLFKHKFTETVSGASVPGVADIGSKMLSTEEGGYALPFEVVSILLLAALVGCIVIAMPLSKTESDQAEKITG